MRVSTLPIDGIYIFAADFTDLDPDTLTEAQQSDTEAITADKRRRERAMTYALVNYAASTDRRFASLHGALLSHRDNGAPFLIAKYPHNASLLTEQPVTISISHSKSGACIALGNQGAHFGIDIEDATDRLSRVARKFLNDKEKHIVSDCDLLRAWTIKEAVYKAAGIDGLTLREGITINSGVQAITTHPAVLTTESEAEADGVTYRCHSLLTPARCLTLAVRDD